MILSFIQAKLVNKCNTVSGKPKYNLILKRTMKSGKGGGQILTAIVKETPKTTPPLIPTTTHANINVSPQQDIPVKPSEKAPLLKVVDAKGSEKTNKESDYIKQHEKEALPLRITEAQSAIDKVKNSQSIAEKILSIKDTLLENAPEDIIKTLNKNSTFDDDMILPVIPAIIIPPALPLPLLQKHLVTFKNETPLDFNKEIAIKAEEMQKNLREKTEDLRSRGLLNDEDKIAAKAYKYDFNQSKLAVPSNFDEETYKKNPKFIVGLLQVTNIEETVCLNGNQSHIVLAIDLQDNKKLVWGYLTSEQHLENILLSDKQPFTEGKQEKKQMMRILKVPFIAEENDVGNLPSLNKDTKDIMIQKDDIAEAHILNQQEILEQYLAQEEVKQLLQKKFEQAIIPYIIKSEGQLPLYDGTGFTYNDLDIMTDCHTQEAEQLVKECLQRYIEMRNQQKEKKISNWFIGKKNTLDDKTMALLTKKIQEYNDKHDKS